VDAYEMHEYEADAPVQVESKRLTYVVSHLTKVGPVIIFNSQRDL
jgi:hypothetical protein